MSMWTLGKSCNFNMIPSSAKIRPGINAGCDCMQGRSCQKCSAAGSETRVGTDLANMILETLSKLDKLTNDVSFLQKCLHVQSVRQQRIEVAGSGSRGIALSSELSNNETSECEGRNSANKSSSRIKQVKNRSNKAKYNNARVNKLNLSSQNEEVSPSEDEFGLGAAERRCEFTHSVLGNGKSQSSSKLYSVSSAVESSPEESSESEDVPKKHRRSKVKSGAVIKKRPVVKTELWPHTIANEEDGENISIDDLLKEASVHIMEYLGAMALCKSGKKVILKR